MNIILIGFRGAGKSVVGEQLAKRLGRKFVDIDDLIEDRHGPISEIVQSQGWEHFRKMEKTAIKEVSGLDHLVIAPGGGAVLDAGNVRSLKKNGLVIWLKADEEVLYRRILEDSRTGKSRPTLTGKGTLEELGELLALRNSYYRKGADIELETSNLDAEGVVERILAIWQENQNKKPCRHRQGPKGNL